MPFFRSRGMMRTVAFFDDGVVRLSTLTTPGGVLCVKNTTAWGEITGAEATWRRPRVMLLGLRDMEIRTRYALTFWTGWACAGVLPAGMIGVAALVDQGRIGYAAAAFLVMLCVSIIAVVMFSDRADILSLHFKTSGGLRNLGDFVCGQGTSEFGSDEALAQQVWDGLLQGLARHDGVSDPAPATWAWRRGQCLWAYAPPGWDTSRVFGHGEVDEDRVVLFRSAP